MGDCVAVRAKRNQIAGRVDYCARIERGNRGNMMHFDEARRRFSIPNSKIQPARLAMATPDRDGSCPVASITFVTRNPLDTCSAFFVAARARKVSVIVILDRQQSKNGCGKSARPGHGSVKVRTGAVDPRFQAAPQ